ncbi:type II toxin-antitoxin system HicA family toxin [Changpingibacter yushuensis]|uniref:type II toxin-antitoxin system HicA family toxin n=1 Tax=Changpingibacter yushuensis TaxID=2758440 RepID=UPI0015F6A4C8|nr:type II toxin-antitoxin system HicA family toxin [Changpingibacter yushuensis]
MTRPQKYRDVHRFLTKHGWVKVRTRGSHEVWVSGDGLAKVTVAAHQGVVSAGIVRQIQAQFPDDEVAKGWN